MAISSLKDILPVVRKKILMRRKLLRQRNKLSIVGTDCRCEKPAGYGVLPMGYADGHIVVDGKQAGVKSSVVQRR